MTKKVSTASQNIRHLRRKYQFTQEEMAQKLGIKRSLLGAYEEDRANPRLDVLVRAAEIFNISVDQLVSEPFNELNATVKVSPPPASPVRTRPATESRKTEAIPAPLQSVQSMHLVPAAEFKQYFFNAVDADYLKKLPEIHLPLLTSPQTTYRAFEVADNSMQPVAKGSVVASRQLESVQQIEDGKLYILVTRTEGVLFRRVFNQIENSGHLLLEPTHPDFDRLKLSVMGREVEAWEVVLFVSPKLPVAAEFPKPERELDLQQLTRLVLDLQQEVIRLKEMVRK
ncbi:MAG: XRE family transcriptional regulator [Cyclobacteriaceae bacterium]